MADPRILAILTVRDEGAFLIDWVAHHRAIGFTDLLVYSNDCSDGTDVMLDRLAELGLVTHRRNDAPHRQGPQWDALKAAAADPVTAAADWIMAIDIDEFVNVHAGDGTLAALLAAIPDATAIPMTWRLFGNGGVARFEDRPVTQVFTHAAPKAMLWPWRASLFKTLYRNDGTYARPGVHRPRNPDPARLAAARWFDGSGRPLPPAFATARIFAPLGEDTTRLVQMNHYALGAMDSFVLKCARGRANRQSDPFDLSYWVERNFATDPDDSILRMTALSAPTAAALRADPVLGPLHAAAVRWRGQRFESLLAGEAWRALFGRLLLTPPSRPLPPAAARFLLDRAAPRPGDETD
jgi:hypothetical protein